MSSSGINSRWPATSTTLVSCGFSRSAIAILSEQQHLNHVQFWFWYFSPGLVGQYPQKGHAYPAYAALQTPSGVLKLSIVPSNQATGLEIDRRQTTTILLAEDEDGLRKLLHNVFVNAGFTVLIAGDGQQALHVAQGHEGRIDLLVSNIQMPNMTGPELARELKQQRPGVGVMLISAYPDGLLMLDHGWHFLQKPFKPDAIVKKVREVLASEPAEETHRG